MLQEEATFKAKSADLRTQAQHQSDVGSFAAAVGTFNDALLLDPDNKGIEEERDAAARKVRALELKKQGEQEMAAGEYESAVQSLLEALHADPDNKEIAAEEAEAAQKAKAAALKLQADAMMADKAFEEAIKRSYTHVEVDARMTVDGHVVCFHNDSLFEEAGVDGRISELPLREVTQIVLPRSKARTGPRTTRAAFFSMTAVVRP